MNFKRWIIFWASPSQKRVSRSTLLRNAKKLDKSLQVASMPRFLSVGIIKEESTCTVEVA